MREIDDKNCNLRGDVYVTVVSIIKVYNSFLKPKKKKNQQKFLCETRVDMQK